MEAKVRRDFQLRIYFIYLYQQLTNNNPHYLLILFYRINLISVKIENAYWKIIETSEIKFICNVSNFNPIKQKANYKKNGMSQ